MASVLDRVREWAQVQVVRFLGVGITVGSSSGAPLPASPRYDTLRSLSALVANPWVWTAVQAISTDLSGLPLVAVRGREQLPDHWMLHLLARPNPRVSGLLLRKQLYADLALCRNAYTRIWRGADGRPFQLARIHPSQIRALERDDGDVVGYELTASGRRLSLEEVSHVRDISWTDDASVAYGESAVAALHLGIQIDSDVRKQAGRAARRGRLEMMLSPEGPVAAMPQEATRALVDQYQTATESGNGVYVVGRQIKATPLSLTARDGEFASILDRNRDEVLAVFGVPEVRAGKPSANYGTAVQQMRTYWESRKHDAALFEAEWARISGDGVEPRHSFREVAALQSSNTERLGRVTTLVGLGIDPNAALAYEGFIDAPTIAADVAAPGNPFASVGLPALLEAGIISVEEARVLLGVSGPPPASAPSGPPDVTQPREPKGLLLQLARLYALAGEAMPAIEELAVRSLVEMGLSAEDAAETAAVIHESVAHHVAQSGPGGVQSLRVFGPDHAERIDACLRSTGMPANK